MGRRTKQLVRNRSKPHAKRVKAEHKVRKRARSRGLHPASKKRRVRALRRAKKK